MSMMSMSMSTRKLSLSILSLAPLLLTLLPWLGGNLNAATGTAPADATATSPVPATVAAAVAELQQRALTGNQAFDFLQSLTVEVGPRFAGSDNDPRAVAWAKAKLLVMGFQNVRAEPVQVPRWVRGEASGEILAPYPQKVALVALGGSVSTPGPLIAEVIAVPNLEALDALAPAQVAGKIVFIDQRMRRAQDGSGYGEAVGVRVYGAARAAKLGAAAVLIRSIGTDNDRLPHTGTLRYADDVPKIPAAALSQPDADNLALQLQTGQTVRFRLHLTCQLEAEMRTSANVLAEVLGREKPDEVVLLAAHLDSWDLGTGALDNGAGCAIIAAAAQLIGQLPQPPRRTVRVLLTANEEFGLSGARAYAEKYQAELGSHVAALESDFGAGRLWALRSLVKEDKVPLARAWAELLAPLGIVYRDNSARGGADLGALAAAHIPLFDLRQDGTAYFDYHHTANDTLDKVVPAELQQNVAGYAVLAYLLAENPEDLGRAPESAP